MTASPKAFPYRVPPAGGELRLAFVGQSTYFEVCALDRAVGGIRPMFIEYRDGADPDHMLKQVNDFRPHLVLVFRPEIVPAGLFRTLPAVTMGFLTEPLPRPVGDRHPDLDRRLEYLRNIDASNFDRIVSFDPLIAKAAERSTPSPPPPSPA